MLDLTVTLGQLLIAVSSAGPLLLLAGRWVRRDAQVAGQISALERIAEGQEKINIKLEESQDKMYNSFTLEMKDMRNNLAQMPSVISAMVNLTKATVDKNVTQSDKLSELLDVLKGKVGG